MTTIRMTFTPLTMFAALAFAAVLALTPQAHAAPSTAVSTDTTRLEQDYWKCIDIDDQAAKADKQMGQESLMICSVVSQALQRARFNDDFGLLHAWTTENKAVMLKWLRQASQSN